MPIRLSSGTNVRGSFSTNWGFANAPTSLAFWIYLRWDFAGSHATRHILRGDADSWNVTYATAAIRPANAVVTCKLMTPGFLPTTTTAVNLPWNEVVHYALTFGNDGTGNKVIQYVNGVQVASEALTDSTGQYRGFALGNNTTSAMTGNFDLDDLAVWNRMLTATEVLSLYNKTATPLNVSGGTAYYYWTLDGTDGARVTTTNPGVIATPNSFPLSSGITGSPVWVSQMGPSVTGSAYVGPSGKTLVVNFNRVPGGQRSYASAVSAAPLIRVNGGAPVTLTTNGTTADRARIHVGTATRPYLAYNLKQYGITIQQGDTVQLDCPDGWATCPDGIVGAQTINVANQVGTTPMPIPTTPRTMRVGANGGSAWGYERLFIPTADWAPAILWNAAPANAKGIPTVAGTKGYLNQAGAADRHGLIIPPGRDICLEFKGGDAIIASDANTILLLSETNLGNGWTRRIYNIVAPPGRTNNNNDIRCQIVAPPVDDLRVYVQASPGLEYSFDHPPKWHPDMLDRFRNFRVIRPASWFQCLYHVTDQYNEMFGSYNWGKWTRREHTVSDIVVVGDDAPGYEGFYKDDIYDIQSPYLECTTTTPHGMLTGQPLQWRGGTTPVATEYGGTCTGATVIAASARLLIATATNKLRCACSTNVRKTTFFRGAQQLYTSNTTALRPANGPFTLSCWFKVEGDTTTGTIIESANNYRLWYDATDKKVKFTTYDTIGAKTVVSSTALSRRVSYWLHAEYDTAGTTARLRINNGTADTVAMGATPSTNNTSGVYVGSSGGSAYLNGQISGLAIWKRLLTAQERAWLYNPSWWRGYADIGVGGNDGANLKTNLAAYYHMGQWGTYDPNGALLTITDQHTGGVTLAESSVGSTKAGRGDHARPATASGLDWKVGIHVGTSQPPAEYAEFVANIPDCDLWLSVPYMLNAAGVAAMLRDTFSALPRGRKVILELGNEPWNTTFNSYLTYTALARSMSRYGKDESNWYQVYIDHWLVMVDAAKQVAAEMRRSEDLLPALSGWFVFDHITNNYCTYLNSLGRLSELKYMAYAPYLRLQALFSRNIGTEGAPVWENITEAGQVYDTADLQLTYGDFDGLSGTSANTVASYFQAHRTRLDAAGANHVKMACYEASVDFVRSVTGENISSFLPMYTTCHPQARHFYHRFLQICQDAGVEYFCDFVLGHPYYGHIITTGGKMSLWSKYASLDHRPGVGDGSDGRYDNRNFMMYDANGVANGDFKLLNNLSSPIGQAYIEWGALVPSRLFCAAPQVTDLKLTSVQLDLPLPYGGDGPYTFQWYRGHTRDFVPGAETMVVNETGPRLIDSRVKPGETYYYCCLVKDSSTPIKSYLTDVVAATLQHQKKSPPKLLFPKRPLPSRTPRRFGWR